MSEDVLPPNIANWRRLIDQLYPPRAGFVEDDESMVPAANVEALIAASVALERELCAQTAELMFNEYSAQAFCAGKQIAAAIRARP